MTNFFEQQDRARKNSFYFLLIFSFCIFSTAFCTGMLFLSIFASFSNFELTFNPFNIFNSLSTSTIFLTFICVLSVILLGYKNKLALLNQGGYVVAEELGAKQIFSQTATKEEKVLINVVEEMAIASTTPPPEIYVLEQKGINAFVAGTNPQNAIICVTRGALRYLNKEELQGVVAHEFSHIFNGDMSLNIKTTAVMYGVLYIVVSGMHMILPLSFRDEKRRDKFILYPVFILLGILLFAISTYGLFFSTVVNLFINKEREYLADASAVQFTIFPDGILGALKKIVAHGRMIRLRASSAYSHMYYSNP
ncbi:MAG: M48 family metalloprotease, partial [Campylobacteraceae bacterium]